LPPGSWPSGERVVTKMGGAEAECCRIREDLAMPHVLERKQRPEREIKDGATGVKVEDNILTGGAQRKGGVNLLRLPN